MQAKEIEVGGVYVARISGRIVKVRVDAIRTTQKFSHSNYSGKSEYRDATVYDVTNLITGRKTTFHSAAKFRSKASTTTAKDQEFAQLNAKRRLNQIETKYSTDEGATEAERQEAKDIATSLHNSGY